MYFFENPQDAQNHIGDCYFGGWIGNNMHGQGVYVYKNTFERYEGQIVGNKKQGKGQFHYANGDIYKGAWAADTRSGRGEMCFANGTIKFFNY